MRYILSVVGLIGLLVVSSPAASARDDQAGCRSFDASMHQLCEPFLTYWTSNGGPEMFGYPISAAVEESRPDAGDDLLVQYFQRVRLEYHPGNDGTGYEVLIGRLGAEMLAHDGVDWFRYPKDEPGEHAYFPETGFAVASEFANFWSSNGLELGDPGVSYRESLAMFGYPLSPQQTAVNPAGDTVVYQWFERARFELRDGGAVEMGQLGVELLDSREAPDVPEFQPGEVIAGGLNHPRGIFAAADGTVYVAQAGAGGDSCFDGVSPGDGSEVEVCFGSSGVITALADGGQVDVVSGIPSVTFGPGDATGAHDVVVVDGKFFGVTGQGGTPADRAQYGDAGAALSHLFEARPGEGWQATVDIGAFEAGANPDGAVANSNPLSLVPAPGGGWVVSDAGANALFHVDGEGSISTLAAFPPQMVPAPPFLGLPDGELIPMESVPTGVAVGPDGAFYVGELTGFPFVPGAARIWRVTADGEATVFADGFTNVFDVAFDTDGNLFVLEMVAGGLLNAGEDISTLAAQLTVITPAGTRAELPSEGLYFATGMAVDRDGTIYISNFGVMPGEGQVVRFTRR